MTQSAPLREDIIDAVFRPVIGLFVGAALGHLSQLAEITGWVPAIAYGLVLAGVAFAWIWMYEQLRRVSDWFFDKTGIAPRPGRQLRPIPKRKKHWFVRYGWIAGLFAGLASVLILPEGAIPWL